MSFKKLKKKKKLGGTPFFQHFDTGIDTNLVKGRYSQGKWHISLSRHVCLKLVYPDTFPNKLLKCKIILL